MIQAKEGDNVKVHYTGRLESGEIFDSSEHGDCECPGEPLEFTVGDGNVIPGFDQAVVGMAVGDSRTVHIPMDEAYGPRMEEMVASIPRADLPPDLNPQIGQQLEVTRDNGETFPVLVTEITDESVTLDANHPLAGRDLIFDIRLVAIN